MKRVTQFEIFVAYSQILVHYQSHTKPGLLWSDAHVAQGFAWTDGLVSFGVPDHDGACWVNVQTTDEPAQHSDDAIWAVQVPFRVPEALKIGTVFDMRNALLPLGQSNLVFEALPVDALPSERRKDREDFAFVLNLTFHATEEPGFAILKRGGEIETDQVLQFDADYAT